MHVYKVQRSSMIAAARNKDGRYVNGTRNTRPLFAIKIKETAGALPKRVGSLQALGLEHLFNNVRGMGCNGITVYHHDM